MILYIPNIKNSLGKYTIYGTQPIVVVANELDVGLAYYIIPEILENEVYEATFGSKNKELLDKHKRYQFIEMHKKLVTELKLTTIQYVIANGVIVDKK